MRITYTQEILGYMNIFDTTTQVRPKDCFIDDAQLLHFVVQEHDVGKAIGKHGMKVQLLEQALKRKIKILPFNPEIGEFIKGLISPLTVDRIACDGESCIITAVERMTKAKLIGRNGMRLRALEDIVKRYFTIKKIVIA